MRISIVTLSFNGSKETLELLKSLESQTDSDFEIIVVDNASEEVIHIPTSSRWQSHRGSSIESGQVGYPQVKVIRNSQNLGFSGGNNVGIHQALKNGLDWVVLLNNDTWVEKGFVENLKVILSVKRGIIGIPLIEGNKVAYCGKIQWLKPTLIHIPTSQVGYPQVYAIGGAMAVHKDIFNKIGLLDEKYFLYFEDADFSIRARKAGFDISIAENVNVHHRVSSTTKKLGLPLLLYYHYRNALYFNLKNGPWYIKVAAWPWSWIIVVKQIIKIATKQNTKESKAILNGVLDFYKNKMGKIK